jgi:hypothetical protein
MWWKKLQNPFKDKDPLDGHLGWKNILFPK